MEGTHEVGRRPFMPDSTLNRRSVALSVAKPTQSSYQQRTAKCLLKFQFRNAVRLTVNIFFCYLHSWWPLFQARFLSTNPILSCQGATPSFFPRLLPFFYETEG